MPGSIAFLYQAQGAERDEAANQEHHIRAYGCRLSIDGEYRERQGDAGKEKPEQQKNVLHP